MRLPVGPVSEPANRVGEPVRQHEHQPGKAHRLNGEDQEADDLHGQFEKPDDLLGEIFEHFGQDDDEDQRDRRAEAEPWAAPRVA